MTKPMPSPRGTNKSAMFVADSFPTPAPAAAYDAAPAGETESKASVYLKSKLTNADRDKLMGFLAKDDGVSKAAKIIKGKLSAAEMAELIGILAEEDDEDQDGELAQDSRSTPTTADRKAFVERFPGAARIKHV